MFIKVAFINSYQKSYKIVGPINSICYSSKGEYLISASGNKKKLLEQGENAIHVIDTNSYKVIFTYESSHSGNYMVHYSLLNGIPFDRRDNLRSDLIG